MNASNLYHQQRQKLISLYEFCGLGKLSFRFLALSFVLLIVAAAFEGFSFGLLVPFLKQAANMGAYEGWRNIPVIGIMLHSLHFERATVNLNILLIVIVLAVIIRQCATYFSQALYYSATLSFESQLRRTGYNRILSYGCIFFDTAKKGEIHNTLMRFTSEVADLMRTIFDLIKNLFFGFVYMVTLLVISPGLFLTSIVVSPIFYFSLQRILKKIHILYSSILNTEQKEHGVSLDVFSNVKLVKAMNREADEAATFEKSEAARTKHSILAYSLYLLLSPLQEIFLTIGIAIILWLSFTYYFHNDASFIIKLIVAVLIFRRSVQVVNGILSQLPQAIRRLPFARELRALLNEKNKAITQSGTHTLEIIRKGIEFRRVSMSYGENNGPALNDVSFFIPAGSFTAIVGSSGAGKSTLVELLPRFYEYQDGDIYIDGISVKDYRLDSLRSSIGFVSQDNLVLNDTIYNNILYANSTATKEQVMAAARKAHVFSFASRLPHHMDTLIGDRGVKLSGGELQRLAIARAILRNPLILVLDEATSALDSQSEKLIQEALAGLTANRTTIAIAHRLSTIRHAAQILVFENGRVVECGTLQDLLAKKNVFYGFWESQKF